MYIKYCLAGWLLLSLGVHKPARAEEAPPGVNSELWGAAGERWQPEGRLPDFSFAGYRRGEAAIPTPPATHNVRDFGAVGDGEQDDSDAFLRAIEAAASGVIFVPEGRYVIRKKLVLDKPNLVLRGAGPGKTVLYFPVPLNDIAPNWGATTSGRPTSNYSWSGGLVTIQGDYQSNTLARVVAPALRASHSFVVDSPEALTAGQEIEIQVRDTEENTLAMHLYSEDPRTSIENIAGRTRAALVARITAISDNKITIDRPLRFDLREEWQPTVLSFEPTVMDSGIEDLGFDFPNTPYEGHFTELGFNAFAITRAPHCWARNLHIHNSDSGGFVSSYFVTLENIVFTSDREPEPQPRQAKGHHGLTVGNDNLVTGFDFQTKFIHDLTVSGTAGNVFADGKGLDLSFDHHRRAPFENLFTNIHVGTGATVWNSGGGQALGAHCGARGVFWNIRADQPIAPPADNWGPWSMVFVGVHTEAPAVTLSHQRWWEPIPPGQLQPQNLHQAQLERRLNLMAAPQASSVP